MVRLRVYAHFILTYPFSSFANAFHLELYTLQGSIPLLLSHPLLFLLLASAVALSTDCPPWQT